MLIEDTFYRYIFSSADEILISTHHGDFYTEDRSTGHLIEEIT